MKILLLSDLHAVPSDNLNEHSSSRLILDPQGTGEFGDSLITYLQNLNEDIDYIVCCGDIANKGCGKSFQIGWKFLQNLKTALNDAALISVPGNHDHQSRPPTSSNSDGFSPKHQLQFCSPKFPFDCHNQNTHFWAWNWVIDDSSKECNFLCLNTSAYHGYADEYKHGRIATETVKQIKNHLESTDYESKPLNILICHHHPQTMEHAYEDYDGEQMNGGQSLINTLQEVDVGPWLILHGHKHFACISSASTQSQTPSIVFSAGSISAKLQAPIKTITSNQIYLIDIEIDKTASSEKIVGKFSTHEYTVADGWRLSRSENLPAKSGLGSKKDAIDVINQIKEMLKSTPFLQQNELLSVNAELSYFTPREFKKFKSRLDTHRLAAELDTTEQKVIEVAYRNEQ